MPSANGGVSMAKDILKFIKKCDVIFSNGQDVLVGGVHLWLFRADGEFVKKVLPIRRPCKAVFIPNRTALVEGAGDCAYYYLDLKTGEILWITKKKAPEKRGNKPLCGFPGWLHGLQSVLCLSGQNDVSPRRTDHSGDAYARHLSGEGAVKSYGGRPVYYCGLVL